MRFVTTSKQAYSFCRVAGIELLKQMISDAPDPVALRILQDRLRAVRSLPTALEPA